MVDLVLLDRVCMLRVEPVSMISRPGEGQQGRLVPIPGRYRRSWVNLAFVCSVDPEMAPGPESKETGRTVVTTQTGQLLVDENPSTVVQWLTIRSAT